MDERQGTRIADLMRERDRALALLLNLERQIAEFGKQKRDLFLEIADAEDRGQWARVAQLRARTLSE